MNTDINTEVDNAFEVIKNGGIILYPTDTVWGIGCDGTNPEAVKKIYALKQREESKSMIVLMNGERMMYNVFKEIPEVVVDTGTLRLDFYDNAEIDGDSITVLVNKKVIISHQKLSSKPITVFVTIDLSNTFQEIEMVAENLGSIPPNTAVLIITAGDKKYQLFLSSTKSKSAMVRFVYDKKT